MSDAPQGPTLGRYVLERRIASGGMADVYLARQSGPYGFSKRVALKVLKREIAGDDDNVKAFIREALVAAEFRHPNLAQVYEVGENNGQLFLAMELVTGISVAAMMHMLVERGRELPRNVAVRIAIDTLDGLAHAHEAKDPDGKPLGLVHRDISPQNIMVSVDGSVKVVDFGIARAEMAFGRTVAPRIKGKFSYMAPEQWDAEGKLDARADLFAVGVVLYEMSTGGVRLFRGEGPRDLYKSVVIDAIPDPRTRDPSYP
ncbi:MAG: serine/threonine-protein kinase, partial [Deltaproteobacteria bacterium]